MLCICAYVFCRPNGRMCVFILVIGMFFSFSNFLYPYGHQICFDESILSFSLVHTHTLFQSMCKCRRQAKCIRVSALLLAYKKERGRDTKSAQSIFSFISSILIFLLLISTAFSPLSINTYWSVYSRNKIHLTSNKCRAILGLNDFSENLASHWTAPDLHAVIFCIHTHFRCVCVLCIVVYFV